VSHHILFYDYVDNMLELRVPHRDAHLAHTRSGKDAGEIVMAGALGDPPHGGVLVFAEDVEPARIEAFVDADPYVTADLVTTHRIEPWTLV
jgi:uncharacterized protein